MTNNSMIAFQNTKEKKEILKAFRQLKSGHIQRNKNQTAIRHLINNVGFYTSVKQCLQALGVNFQPRILHLNYFANVKMKTTQGKGFAQIHSC
mgnify:CR=1 FL=1